MRPDKAELKIQTANDIGASIEDQLDAAIRTQHQYEGGQIALVATTKNFAGILAQLDKDLAEGKLDPKELDISSADALHAIIKRWLGKTIGSIMSQKDALKSSEIAASGMVTGIKRCMEIPKKIMDAEREKLEGLLQAIEEGQVVKDPETGDFVAKADGEPGGRPPPRVAGARPENPLANRKKTASKKRPARKPRKRK